MTGYEAVHRELREAEAATRGATLGMSVTHVAASEALWKFHERTGPLVEDLAAAVRRDFELVDMLTAEREPRMRNELAMQRLDHRHVTRAALAALDEAARG